MSRSLSLYILCLGLIAGGVACGDDDDNVGDAGSDGGALTDSGAPMKDGSVGTAGSGGAGAVGGTGGAGADAGEPYQCMPPAPEAGGSAKAGEACCGGLGVCTANVTGPGSKAYALDECKAGRHLKCAPVLPGSGADAGDEDGGTAGAIQSCRVELPMTLGNFDLEGRCAPSCFVAGDATAANLGQSSCDKGSKCVPCYSPVTGKKTGACNQAGDHPVDPAPPGFAACGDSDAGYCVSADAIASGASMAMLPQLTCKTGEVCAPKVKVLDPKACFAHCDSMLGGPGACISSFIVPMATRALLLKSTCNAGEICAPCISPIDKSVTGACR